MNKQAMYFIWFLIVVFSCGQIAATVADPVKSYDILYNEAVQAYLEENWDRCVSSMNEAVEDFHFYRQTQVGCRLKCHSESSDLKLFTPNRLEDMKFFEKLIRQTLCLLKCKKKLLKNRAEIVSKTVTEDFENLKPYDYLQLCYFKQNNLLKAASCAYTFLTLNPDHEVMKENLRFYINEQKVDPDYIVNLEAKAYVEPQIRGNEAYKNGDYATTANYMETSLTEYLEAEEECRAMCEAPFDQGWFPDFISSVSNHYTFTLRCKQRCNKKLSLLNGELYENFLPSHYHYLQYAYFKLGDLYKACQAAASYSLFFPGDKTMEENKKFYMTLEDVTPDMWEPRPEALFYFERDEAEKALIRYIDTHFQFDEGDISEPNTVNQGDNETPDVDTAKQNDHETSLPDVKEKNDETAESNAVIENDEIAESNAVIENDDKISETNTMEDSDNEISKPHEVKQDGDDISMI